MKPLYADNNTRFLILDPEQEKRLFQLHCLYRRLWYKWRQENDSFASMFGNKKKAERVQLIRAKLQKHIEWYIHKTIPNVDKFVIISRGSDKWWDIKNNIDQNFILLYILEPTNESTS